MAASTSGDKAADDSLYPIAVLIDELKNEDIQVRVRGQLRRLRVCVCGHASDAFQDTSASGLRSGNQPKALTMGDRRISNVRGHWATLERGGRLSDDRFTVCSSSTLPLSLSNLFLAATELDQKAVDDCVGPWRGAYPQ